MTDPKILIAATVLHDYVCQCDRRYRNSCPTFAQAILTAGAAAGKKGKDLK